MRLTALIYAGPTAQVPSPTTGTDASTQAAPAETAAVVVLTEPAAIPMTYTVSLDVNPSIELVVTDGLVATVGTFNDDGQQVPLPSTSSVSRPKKLSGCWLVK